MKLKKLDSIIISIAWKSTTHMINNNRKNQNLF
jgi:hypothetical protein